MVTDPAWLLDHARHCRNSSLACGAGAGPQLHPDYVCDLAFGKPCILFAEGTCNAHENFPTTKDT